MNNEAVTRARFARACSQHSNDPVFSNAISWPGCDDCLDLVVRAALGKVTSEVTIAASCAQSPRMSDVGSAAIEAALDAMIGGPR